ncbi:MAG TPA: hypothetical protein VMF07_18065 [Solirubrobacteraceae bacterium]|nr:hypothetical protein [Solirubrobacteraceae bacterium]
MAEIVAGRALVPWMDDADRQRLDRGDGAAPYPDYSAALAERPPLDQSGVLASLPADLAEHAAAVRASEGAQRMLREGWEIAWITDLRRVVAAQSRVTCETSPGDEPVPPAGDRLAVARLALPLTAPPPTIVQELSEPDQTWTITSPNPNLRISGAFGGEVSPGVHGFGFLFSEMPSYLSVAECDGRLVLRDGYHRSFRLIAAGVVEAPAFVRRFARGETLLRGGRLPESAYLSERPPTLADFHDDRFAIDVRLQPRPTVARVQASPAGLAIGTIA